MALTRAEITARYRAKHLDRGRADRNAYMRQYRLAHKLTQAQRDALNKLTRQWKQEHPELRRLYNNRRRTAQRGLPATLTAAQWTAIQAAYRYRCAYCHQRVARLTQDHVIPVSKGGGYTADNIVPACGGCNQSKGNRPALSLPPIRLLI